MTQKTDWGWVEGLVNELSGVTGLKCYHGPVPAMQTPACYPLPSQTLGTTWDPNKPGRVDCDLVVVVQWGAAQQAQFRLLLEYTSAYGTNSIPAFLVSTSHRTLGGTVEDVRVVSIEKPELLTIGQNQVYLSRTIRLQVYPIWGQT